MDVLLQADSFVDVKKFASYSLIPSEMSDCVGILRCHASSDQLARM